MNDDDSCARRAGRSPTVARWLLFVRVVSVEPAGLGAPSRGGKFRHRPLLALRDESDRQDSYFANCFTLSTCCRRSCMSERWTVPCSSQPVIRRSKEEAVSSRCSATAAWSSGCSSNSARHKPVSRPGCQSGSQCDVLALPPLGNQVLVAVRLPRLPGGHLVAGRRQPDQPPQPFAPLSVPETDPLTGSPVGTPGGRQRRQIPSEKRDVVVGLRRLAGRTGPVVLATDSRPGDHRARHPGGIPGAAPPVSTSGSSARNSLTRRFVDRIVGCVSPVLLRAVDQTRSAGRVQSVAAQLVVECER